MEAPTPSEAVFPDGLHITELMQAKVRELAAKTTFLHAAKCNASIAGTEAIDEYASTFGRDAIFCASASSAVNTVADKPKSLSFASAKACSAFFATVIAATGPNSS